MRENATRYDKIMLLTDLTEKSQAALGYARAFAKFYNAALVLLHVLPVKERHIETLGSCSGDDSKARIVRERLELIAKALRDEGIPIQVRLCRSAVITQTILRNIRTTRPDLIIQGTACEDGICRPLVGSVAEAVLRSTDRPVLTVPSGTELPSSKALRFNRILFATDFGNAVRIIAPYALALAEEFGSRVYLCHVHTREESSWSKNEISATFKTELQQLVAPSVSDWCDPICVVEFGKSSETILKLAKKEKCDLIVLGAHVLGPFGTRGKPGTVFRVICEANCPVLTIASSKREEANSETESMDLLNA